MRKSENPQDITAFGDYNSPSALFSIEISHFNKTDNDSSLQVRIS